MGNGVVWSVCKKLLIQDKQDQGLNRPKNDLIIDLFVSILICKFVL